MSVLRISCLAIACCITLALIWLGVDQSRTGSVGEVGAILQPLIVLFFFMCSAFSATVVALIAFWHRRRAQIVLLCVVSGAVALAVVFVGSIWISGIISDRAWAREQAEVAQFEADREAAIRPIAERYYALMVSGTLKNEEIAALRIHFDLEIKRTGFKSLNWARSTGYFRSAHDLYMRLFVYREGHMPAFSGLHDPNACLDINAKYGSGFNDRQNQQYAEFCPEWVTRYAQ